MDEKEQDKVHERQENNNKKEAPVNIAHVISSNVIAGRVKKGPHQH